MEEILLRKCSKCNIDKPLECFGRHISGRRYTCKECSREIYHRSEQAKSKRKKRMETSEFKLHRRKYRIDKKEYVMWHSAKCRAKRKNIAFNIEITDIIIPVVCPVFGINIIRDSIGNGDNSPALDRIDNTKGYIKGNICVISFKANRLKNNGTLDELAKIVEYMKKYIQPTESIS